MIVRPVSLAVVLMAATALGQGAKPTVVLAPLELEPNPALARFDEPLREQYLGLVRDRAGVLTPTKKEMEHALTELKRRDFRDSKEALAQLAQKAGTMYALYAWVSYTQKGMLVLNGQVVRDDGKAMKSAQVQLMKGDDTVVSVVKVLTLQLFKELGLGSLPTTREEAVVVPPPAAPDAGVVAAAPDAGVEFLPPPMPPPAEKELPAGKKVGWALFGVGAAAAVAGGVVTGVGISMQPVPGANGQLATEAEVTQYKNSKTMQTAGLVTLAAGGAVAIAGLIAVLVTPDVAQTPQVAFVPIPGGAAVTVGGYFP